MKILKALSGITEFYLRFFFLLGTFKLVNENKSGLMNLSDCLNSLREETLTSLNIDGVYYCDVPVIFNLIGVS